MEVHVLDATRWLAREPRRVEVLDVRVLLVEHVEHPGRDASASDRIAHLEVEQGARTRSFGAVGGERIAAHVPESNRNEGSVPRGIVSEARRHHVFDRARDAVESDPDGSEPSAGE